MTQPRIAMLNRTRIWCRLAPLLVGLLVPGVASAVQSAELYRTQAYFYGRFEARVRFAPGEGVISSFFLWKDGSSSTTSWNELDYEKINATCRLQTNIWTAKGTQSAQINTPTFDICADYHTYAFEWTPDYIAWLIDGAQIRKVTGASVTEYTQNASQGMAIHFNVWAGNSTFGGTLDASKLPVHQFLSWVQYSSYANGAFQLQWREDFAGSALASSWATGTWESPYNLSTHNPANVGVANGIATLSMTADNATGFTGTPPVDSSDAGGSGSGGTSGTGGAAATGGRSGSGGMSSTGGSPGTGGAAATGGASGTGGAAATGGASGTGGAATTGGVSGTGGNDAGSGGNSASTGGNNAGSGGTSGTGGSNASTGGMSGTGGSNAGTGGSNAGSGGASNGASGGTGGGGCNVAGQGPIGGGGLIALSLVAACMLRRRGRPTPG